RFCWLISLRIRRGLANWPTIIRQRVRSTFLQRLPDRIANFLLLTAEMRVPKAHYFNTARLQPGISFRVFLSLVWQTVLKTIHFNIKSRLDAEEIQEVWPERVLPPKLIIREPSVTKPAPEKLFRPSIMFAEHPRSPGQFGRSHGI